MAENDLYQLKVHYQVADAFCQFTMGYRMGDGTYTVDTPFAVIEKYVASYLPSLLQAISTQCEVDHITFGPIGISTELAAFGNMDNADGVLVGDALPANMCAIIHLGTVAPNSKHNGRIFISGVPEDVQFEGIMTAPQLQRVQDFADLLFNPLVPDSPEDTDFAPVVISRFVDGVKRVPPVAFDILAPLAKGELRQQQRRTTDRLGIS